MNHYPIVLLSSILLLQVAQSESVTSQPAQPSQQTQPSQQAQPSQQTETKVLSNQEVEAYMEAMVVEKFNIHRANLKDALKHLDDIIEPYGLQILFRPHADESIKVSLKTRDLSMGRNLSFLCRQVGYDWWVDEGVIIVGMLDSDETLITEFIPVSSSTVRRFTTNRK
ncbi:MAG: hypothetical protein ACPGSB_03705 [Opitutales bacterium]